MEIISYISLYNYLIKVECLSNIEAIRSINRIRRLDSQIKKALFVWSTAGKVDLTIDGVSFDELINEEGFAPIRAFFMLDWIKREPSQAMRYMAVERMARSSYPSEELKENLRSTLQKGGKPIPEEVKEDNSDITIE